MQGEDGLQVGLVEAGVDPLGVGHLELAVQVDLVVDRVDQPVQALTGARVGALGDHDQGVLGGQPGQGQSLAGVGRTTSIGLAVERGRDARCGATRSIQVLGARAPCR